MLLLYCTGYKDATVDPTKRNMKLKADKRISPQFWKESFTGIAGRGTTPKDLVSTIRRSGSNPLVCLYALFGSFFFVYSSHLIDMSLRLGIIFKSGCHCNTAFSLALKKPSLYMSEEFITLTGINNCYVLKDVRTCLNVVDKWK